MAQGKIEFNQIEKIAFADTPACDAFGRLRVSQPAYLFDSQFTYQIDADQWDAVANLSSGGVSGTGGTVAHSATERWVTLTTGTAAANIQIIQSHYNPPYTPGRSHLALITFLFGSALAPSAVTRRVGLLDCVGSGSLASPVPYGIYLEQTAAVVNLVLASGTTLGTETVAQAAWNIDKMNGTGPSRKTVDWSKTQILVISYQALYVGRVVIGLDIDGVIYPVHQFLHANLSTYPYIQEASLPVHYSIRTSGASSAATMRAICATVMNEGGQNLLDMAGRTFSVNGLATAVSCGSGAVVPIISIANQATLNSIAQNSIVIPTAITAFSTSAKDTIIQVWLNPTLTGATYGKTIANSSVSGDTAATAMTGGTLISSLYAPAGREILFNSQVLSKLIMSYSDIIARGDVLTVSGTGLGGTASCYAAINWKEIR